MECHKTVFLHPCLLLYMRQISNSDRLCRINQYVNDTRIYTVGRLENIGIILEGLNDALDKVGQWSQPNSLYVNHNKSAAMCLGSSSVLGKTDPSPNVGDSVLVSAIHLKVSLSTLTLDLPLHFEVNLNKNLALHFLSSKPESAQILFNLPPQISGDLSTLWSCGIWIC